MKAEVNIHSENMRVTIASNREGTTLWASIHEREHPAYMAPLTIFLSYERPAELAAWEALAAALAAQDVPATEEV